MSVEGEVSAVFQGGRALEPPRLWAQGGAGPALFPFVPGAKETFQGSLPAHGGGAHRPLSRGLPRRRGSRSRTRRPLCPSPQWPREGNASNGLYTRRWSETRAYNSEDLPRAHSRPGLGLGLPLAARGLAFGPRRGRPGPTTTRAEQNHPPAPRPRAARERVKPLHPRQTHTQKKLQTCKRSVRSAFTTALPKTKFRAGAPNPKTDTQSKDLPKYLLITIFSILT